MNECRECIFSEDISQEEDGSLYFCRFRGNVKKPTDNCWRFEQQTLDNKEEK